MIRSTSPPPFVGVDRMAPRRGWERGGGHLEGAEDVAQEGPVLDVREHEGGEEGLRRGARHGGERGVSETGPLCTGVV